MVLWPHSGLSGDHCISEDVASDFEQARQLENSATLLQLTAHNSCHSQSGSDSATELGARPEFNPGERYAPNAERETWPVSSHSARPGHVRDAGRSLVRPTSPHRCRSPMTLDALIYTHREFPCNASRRPPRNPDTSGRGSVVFESSENRGCKFFLSCFSIPCTTMVTLPSRCTLCRAPPGGPFRCRHDPPGTTPTTIRPEAE